MLQLERLERQLEALRQMVATYRAAGIEVPMPDAGEERGKFDEWLNSPPRPLTPTEALLRELEVA